jgi:outer membrane protein OmpA-like peptidoglycan-associated protein
MGRHAWAVRLVLLVTVAASTCGCSNPVAGVPTAAPDAAPTASDAEETPALPPGAEPGLDDLNGDGEPDPTCDRQDYGGGLVLRVPCDIAVYSQPPTEDTQLVPNSVYGFPGFEIDLSEVSGTALQARNAAGQRVVMFFISSDTLFDVGSSTLSDPARASFTALIRILQERWPTALIQIRGHTDSTGRPAANQRLSERRAAAALEFSAENGIDRSRLSSMGLGPTVPIVLETRADGSVNEIGQQYNRRVEFVVTVP